MANFQHTTEKNVDAVVRIDPVGERYFRPLRAAETVSDFLFWMAAGLSFAVILINKENHPIWYIATNIAFVVSVVALFVIGIFSRLNLSPRAEDGRRRDLFTNSFDIALTHETTTGYYNNDETNSFRRLALSVMESSFFSMRISQAMLFRTRLLAAVYAIAWLCMVLLRETDFGLIAVAVQTLFSEILLSKWLRLEWLRQRSEQVYIQLSQLLKNARTFNKPLTHAQVVECVSYYETSKSNAGIVLSDNIFKKMNPSLSQEWKNILKTIPSTKAKPRARVP
jgi:hypothetical protein